MNEAFRLLFDQVKSGVVWVQRDGQVRYANKAAVQLTPLILGQPLLDPVAQRTVLAAAQGMLKLPFSFELTTQEQHPDTIRAAVIDAPVGQDLMLVLNNVSQERWYSRALENLVGYIEAEMAQPITVLAQKLPRTAQLVQQQGATGDLQVLVSEASALSARLGKLRDLVSVFGESTLVCDERIMLPELISSAVNEVLPQAHGRNITLALAPSEAELPAIYGSLHWLRKATAEYLEQSIRSAQRGSLLELSIQSVGTRVMVRARNQGLFISSHDRRNAFAPFGVGDTAHPSDSRKGVGLALAQRILALHGGAVRIDDEFDSVDFVMELPAGAPSTQDAQLSVEQAQRYARDMSRLLARSMSRKPATTDSGQSADAPRRHA
jgi:signal transduction histidine kinase